MQRSFMPHGEDPAPPWTTLRTLEDSSRRFEEDDSDEAALAVLLRPGSSLGGARPKASVTAPDDSLWIAKFPSKEDEFDMGAWEYLVHVPAPRAGGDVRLLRKILIPLGRANVLASRLTNAPRPLTRERPRLSRPKW